MTHAAGMTFHCSLKGNVSANPLSPAWRNFTVLRGSIIFYDVGESWINPTPHVVLT